MKFVNWTKTVWLGLKIFLCLACCKLGTCRCQTSEAARSWCLYFQIVQIVYLNFFRICYSAKEWAVLRTSSLITMAIDKNSRDSLDMRCSVWMQFYFSTMVNKSFSYRCMHIEIDIDFLFFCRDERWRTIRCSLWQTCFNQATAESCIFQGGSLSRCQTEPSSRRQQIFFRILFWKLYFILLYSTVFCLRRVSFVLIA